ncbi:MAG: hypothetical protein V7695_11150 [Sulfitobacter sp.]
MKVERLPCFDVTDIALPQVFVLVTTMEEPKMSNTSINGRKKVIEIISIVDKLALLNLEVLCKTWLDGCVSDSTFSVGRYGSKCAAKHVLKVDLISGRWFDVGKRKAIGTDAISLYAHLNSCGHLEALNALGKILRVPS